MSEVTRLLDAIDRGDRQAAADLLPLVYDELRRLAAARLAQERAGQTFQPTALVHEAYLRLVGGAKPQAAWDGRGHFFAAAAEAMRRILVENARRKRAEKRGGDRQRVPLDAGVAAPEPADDLLALDEALTELAARDAQKARLVELRYFAGLTADEAAAVLGISPSTADRLWTYARAWLRRRVAGGG
jgi:RNA polymerase sigma factor (TIGR02999 family)